LSEQAAMKGRITTISRILLGDTRSHQAGTDLPHCHLRSKKIGGANLQFNGVNNTQVEIDVRLLARR
jgi:hypothetical protein